jgi:hypothetical protein
LLDKDWQVDNDRVTSTTSPDARELAKDWAERGQERPLWIEPGGLVRNGNRRLAMIKRTYGEAAGDEHVEVIVLDPDDFDGPAMFDLEAREQLTEGLKVRYTDINLLLTLQEAADRYEVQWHDLDSIARGAERIAPLTGNSISYARTQLNAVKYMTDYLAEIGRPGEYGLLRGTVEVFRDVGKNMKWAFENDPDAALEMLYACFAAVTSGAPYQDVRELRALAKADPDRFSAFVEELRDVRATAPPEPAPEPPAATVGEDEDDEDEDEGAAATSAVADYPRTAVKNAIDLAARMSRATRSPRPDNDLRLAADHLSRVPVEVLADLLGGPRGVQVAEARDAIVAWGRAADPADGG